MKEQLLLELPSDLKYLRLASLAGAEAARIALTGADAPDIDPFIHAFELAMTETFSNAARYRPPDPGPWRVIIEIEITAEKEMIITVKDRNPGFDIDLEHRQLPDIATYPSCGFGLCLVKQIMDSVTYRRENGWNIITISKTIKSEHTA